MMYMVFELKARHELTWEDFPYIENPFFSHYRAMTALSEGHDFFGRRVHNIEQFKRKYVPYYDHSFNHQIVSDELRRHFFSGQFFSVARDKIPFSPSFKWRVLGGHPDGGEWYAAHPIYGDTLKQQLEDLAKRLSAQKRRWAAEEAEDNTSAAALIPTVKRVIEKSVTEKPAVQPTPQPMAAQTIEECEQRLGDAREQLIRNGYQSKYTDEEIQALAQKGELDDRFVVRMIETKYASDSGYLGQMNDGEVKYWSTTFNQMENADTDPQTLCSLIGINYIPDRSYSLVIIDTQAKGAGQSVTIVPTHSKLGAFAKHEIKGINPEAVDGVMTPAYNQEYAKHMVAFNAAGGSTDKEKDITDYADANFSNDADRECFEARVKIHERLGANQHYTGDGTTKNLIAGCPNECGVMETFTYDKSPQMLGALETNGSAKRILMKPL